MEKKSAPKNVDEYLKSFTGQQREALNAIRSNIKAAAPEAEEEISYGMPAYKLNGALVYFGGFKDHCSFFPAGYAVIQQFADELKDFKTSKGTIQFPFDKPIPFALIKKMVKARIKENEARAEAKAAKRKTKKLHQQSGL